MAAVEAEAVQEHANAGTTIGVVPTDAVLDAARRAGPALAAEIAAWLAGPVAAEVAATRSYCAAVLRAYRELEAPRQSRR